MVVAILPSSVGVVEEFVFELLTSSAMNLAAFTKSGYCSDISLACDERIIFSSKIGSFKIANAPTSL